MEDKISFTKGQIMLEMLIIVSFLLIILIPTIIYILSVLSTESWKTDANQAYSTLTKIVSISNKLAMFGNGSTTSEHIFLPSSVKRINVSSHSSELFITLAGPKYVDMDIVVPTEVEIQLNSSQDWTNVRGTQAFRFVVENGIVTISKKY